MTMWPRLGARRLSRNPVFMKAENSRYVHKYRRYEGEHRRCDAEGQLGLWLELARAWTWPLGELARMAGADRTEAQYADCRA